MRFVLRLCFSGRVRKQLLAFGLTPQISKFDLASTRRLFAAHQQGDCCSDLYAFAIVIRRKNAGVGFTFRGYLSGLVFVTVQAIDPEAVELLEIPIDA